MNFTYQHTSTSTENTAFFGQFSAHPYGMLLPGRHGSAGSGYRYGFQGQEQDDEIAGEGNSLTAEFWQYDTRLGRRWNIDPVVKYHESPYAAFANNPIWFADPNGADTVNVFSGSIDANGKSAGEDGYNSANPLLLFSTWVDNGFTGSRNMDYGQFSDTYQTVAEDYHFENMNGADHIELDYAKVISINSESEYFGLAVKTISLSQFQGVHDRASSFFAGEGMDNFKKVEYFSHGARYDIKSKGKLLDGYKLTYIEGVGIFTSDYLGNYFYGSIMSEFQDLNRTLNDGDYLQNSFTVDGTTVPDNVDDPLDSYALFLGHLNQGGTITASDISQKSFFIAKTYKYTSRSLGRYNITTTYSFKVNGEYTDRIFTNSVLYWGRRVPLNSTGFIYNRKTKLSSDGPL